LIFDNGFAFVRFAADEDSFNENSIISPIYDLFEGYNSISSSFQDFQEIILNGINIGSGRITSYNFDPTSTINQAEYQVSLELYKEACFDNWSGDGYYNTNFPSGLLNLVTNLNESFSSSEDSNGLVEINRSLSFNMISGGGKGSMQDAKELASGLFWGNPLFAATSFQYPSF
jgi:hypothetical protein